MLLGPRARRLLDAPFGCVLTTVRRDGRPMSTVVWCGRDDDTITLSAGHDVQWLARVRRNPAVAVAVIDPEDILISFTAYGEVTSIEPDPDYAFIDTLSQSYEGRPHAYTRPEDYERLKVVIRLERVVVLEEGVPVEDV